MGPPNPTYPKKRWISILFCARPHPFCRGNWKGDNFSSTKSTISPPPGHPKTPHDQRYLRLQRVVPSPPPFRRSNLLIVVFPDIFLAKCASKSCFFNEIRKFSGTSQLPVGSIRWAMNQHGMNQANCQATPHNLCRLAITPIAKKIAAHAATRNRRRKARKRIFSLEIQRNSTSSTTGQRVLCFWGLEGGKSWKSCKSWHVTLKTTGYPTTSCPPGCQQQGLQMTNQQGTRGQCPCSSVMDDLSKSFTICLRTCKAKSIFNGVSVDLVTIMILWSWGGIHEFLRWLNACQSYLPTLEKWCSWEIPNLLPNVDSLGLNPEINLIQKLSSQLKSFTKKSAQPSERMYSKAFSCPAFKKSRDSPKAHSWHSTVGVFTNPSTSFGQF